MKHVKMRQINGSWYSASTYSSRLLKTSGLGVNGGFLSLVVVANHLAKYNISVKTVK